MTEMKTERPVTEVVVRRLTPEEYPAMRAMAVKRWNREHGQGEYYDLFDLTFIHFIMGGPFEQENAMLGAFMGEALVGTVGLIVFNLSIKGVLVKAAYASFLTSDREKGSSSSKEKPLLSWSGFFDQTRFDAIESPSIGHILTGAVYAYCHDHAIQGIIAYFEEKSFSFQVVRTISQKTPLVKGIFTLKPTWSMVRIVHMAELLKRKDISPFVKFAARLIRLDRLPAPSPHFLKKVIEYEEPYLPDCLALLNEYQERTDMARVWSIEALKHHLSCKGVSRTYLFVEENRVKGMINAQTMASVGNEGIFNYAILDHIHLFRLRHDEKRHFITILLHQFRAMGLTGAILRRMGYCDEGIFAKMGFRKNRRYLDQVFISLDDTINMEGDHTTYLSFV